MGGGTWLKGKPPPSMHCPKAGPGLCCEVRYPETFGKSVLILGRWEGLGLGGGSCLTLVLDFHDLFHFPEFIMQESPVDWSLTVTVNLTYGTLRPYDTCIQLTPVRLNFQIFIKKQHIKWSLFNKTRWTHPCCVNSPQILCFLCS